MRDYHDISRDSLQQRLSDLAAKPDRASTSSHSLGLHRWHAFALGGLAGVFISVSAVAALQFAHPPQTLSRDAMDRLVMELSMARDISPATAKRLIERDFLK